MTATEPLNALAHPIWHPGEVAVQQRLGVAERMAKAAPRIISITCPISTGTFTPRSPS